MSDSRQTLGVEIQLNTGVGALARERDLRKGASRGDHLRGDQLCLEVGRTRVQSCLLPQRSEEHTSELQSRSDLVCRLLLEKKKYNNTREAESRIHTDKRISKLSEK